MKIVLCFLIIVATTYIGYLYDKRYEKRYVFYKQYNDFIYEFTNSISFSNEKLKLFLNKNVNEFKKDVQDIKINERKSKHSFLSEQENNDYHQFIDNLGKGDSESQINLLNSKGKEIFDKMNDAKREMDKYKNLYIKIGFLIGLIIVISVL